MAPGELPSSAALRGRVALEVMVVDNDMDVTTEALRGPAGC